MSCYKCFALFLSGDFDGEASFGGFRIYCRVEHRFCIGTNYNKLKKLKKYICKIRVSTRWHNPQHPFFFFFFFVGGGGGFFGGFEKIFAILKKPKK